MGVKAGLKRTYALVTQVGRRVILGSFMQTKHLCVLIHIWTKGEVGAPLNRFKPSSKIFLLTVPRRCFFCGSFMFFLSCVCYAFVCVCFYVPCGHLLRKGWPLGSRLWCFLWVCYFPIGVLGQVWCLIVLISDLCPLSYFVVSYKQKYGHKVLVNRLVKLAQEKEWLGELTVPTWP